MSKNKYKWSMDKDDTEFESTFVINKISEIRVEDFLGQQILKSKRKCPVCGGKYWYACDFVPPFDELDLSNYNDDITIIDSKGKSLPIEDADICINCLTVITGNRI
jgi:hypothetical protein